MNTIHVHAHEHCEHRNVAYCRHCDCVYCKDCDKEWRDCKLAHYTPYYTSWTIAPTATWQYPYADTSASSTYVVPCNHSV